MEHITLEERRRAIAFELEKLEASWEYAFAFGHGCSIGDHPTFEATRQKVYDLRAQLQELS